MPDTKVLINCNVFDGSSPQVQPDRYVLVQDGEIAEIGPSGSAPAPDGAATVDLQGSYLMAGLFNMHTHF